MRKSIFFLLFPAVTGFDSSFDIFDPFGKIFDPVDWSLDFGYNQVQPILEKNEGKIENTFWTVEEDMGCVACKMGVKIFQMFNTDLYRWLSSQHVTLICYSILIWPSVPWSTQLCPGLIKDFWTEQALPAIFDELGTEQTWCTFTLKVCEQDQWREIDLDEWVFNKINEKPAIVRDNDYMNQLYRNGTSGKTPLKAVLMTDLHLDYDYVIGSKNKNCGRIICCQGDPAENEDEKAEYWGSQQCDGNENTLLSMLHFIRDDIKPDFVLWGGDSVPHNPDSLTPESVRKHLRWISQEVFYALPDTRVYPTMGNHDTYPLDKFNFHKPAGDEFFNSWKSAWDKFLVEPEAIDTFSKWGYYSAYLTYKNGTKIGKTPTKIISMNTNFCLWANFEAF